MAHGTSSLLHKSSFPVHKSSRMEKSQDLLPPRKRLLAGYEQARATSATIPSTPAPPPQSQSLQGEVHVDAIHTSTPPPYNLLLCNPAQKCFSCRDSDVLLHRLPSLSGSSSYHCSSCILAMKKHMYCVICCDILPEEFISLASSSKLSLSSPAPSSGLLTCCRCQRLTHLECALKTWSPGLERPGLTLCKDCNAGNNGQFRESSLKRQKIVSVKQSEEAVSTFDKDKFLSVDMQALAAAQIVAMVAKQGALEARQRAEILARAAACAAMRAKTALVNVQRLGQKKLCVEGRSCTSLGTLQKDEGAAMATIKSPKNLKKRTLSSIVASEILLKKPSRMEDQVASIVISDSKQTGTSLDTACAEVLSAHKHGAEEASSCRTRRAKLAVKRRKTLSSIGRQHPTPNARNTAMLKSSKLPCRRAKKLNPLSKGTLGAIVSQMLASNNLLKSSERAASLRVSSSMLQSARMNDVLQEGIKKNACSINVMALKNGLSSE